MRKTLSDRERSALYGLIRFPHSPDKELATRIGMKTSTFSSIKQRLKEAGYYKTIRVPMLQRLGAELLCVIYTHFNQAVPLEARVKKTTGTIEVFEEIFHSVGDTFRGFSMSMAKNYADITQIEDKRIETFGLMGLLEEEYPTTVPFPFRTSRIDRFLDYAPLLSSNFDIDQKDYEIDTDIDTDSLNDAFNDISQVELSKTEKMVFCALIEYPELSDKALEDIMPVSRHTISNQRRKFESLGLMRAIRIPNLKLLDFDVLAIHHIRYNPSNPPTPDQIQGHIMDDSTIVLFSRRFESFMISAYPDYETAKREGAKKIQYLKSNDLMTDRITIDEFSIQSMILIKDMAFGPISRKMVCQTMNDEN